MVELAIQTGIPMQYWDDADDIMTAAEILEKMGDRGNRNRL